MEADCRQPFWSKARGYCRRRFPPPRDGEKESTAMAQDRQQLDEEVAALRKARSEIDSKLDAAQEKRAGWRDEES